MHIEKGGAKERVRERDGGEETNNKEKAKSTLRPRKFMCTGACEFIRMYTCILTEYTHTHTYINIYIYIYITKHLHRPEIFTDY